MNNFIQNLYNWIYINTGDFSELVFASPLIIIIGVTYWTVRQVNLKRRRTLDCNKTQTKCANELIRLLLLLWSVTICFMTLLPSCFWQAMWSSCIFGINPFFEMGHVVFSGWEPVPFIVPYIINGHFDWFLASLRFKITDYIENVFLFIPLGAALPFVLKKVSFLRVVLIGFCASFLIEFIQGFMGRSGNADDLICNTFGTAIGFAVYFSLNKCFTKLTHKFK